MNIQIVDENDNVIGVKERKLIDPQKDVYRVSALWITNSKGQTLLARRAKQKVNDPGKWGSAVAGTIDEGETYEENIYKEAFEEIGLKGVVFEKGIKMRITYPRNHFCQWFLAQIDKVIDEFIMQEDEVDALEWVSIDYLKKDIISNPEKYTPSMPEVLRQMKIV